MQYVIRPTNSDLQHHGVLGQKWGRKNGPPYPLNSSISTGSKLKNVKNSKGASAKGRLKKKSKAQVEAAKKDINKMSNQELRESNERLRLEQEHERLTKTDKSSSIPLRFSKSIVNKLIEGYANEVASALVGAVGVELGKKAIKYLASYKVMKNGALLLI